MLGGGAGGQRLSAPPRSAGDNRRPGTASAFDREIDQEVARVLLGFFLPAVAYAVAVLLVIVAVHLIGHRLIG